jgi:type IV pilus assembly protein PilF
MVVMHRWGEVASRCVMMAALVAFGMLALGGCASTTSPTSGDLVTSSDEPEARKRARIRLQLAVGYFEQGQTTVALDETKQAINIDPSFVDAYNLRGLIYMKLNDQRLAEESFRRALSLNGNDSNVLHNYAWLQCLQGRTAEAIQTFTRALDNPTYTDRAKTWLTKGLCQVRARQFTEAEQSLNKSYEYDAANPVTGYNLAQLIFQRGDLARAQFYIQRINGGEYANAETLWLGAKIEHRLGNRLERDRLGIQLRNRFPRSRELNSFDRGAFNE